MTIRITEAEVDTLLSELMQYTGETIQQAITNAIKERLVREKAKVAADSSLSDELLQIGRECAALPILDHRTPEEMLGYDHIGLPA